MNNLTFEEKWKVIKLLLGDYKAEGSSHIDSRNLENLKDVGEVYTRIGNMLWEESNNAEDHRYSVYLSGQTALEILVCEDDCHDELVEKVKNLGDIKNEKGKEIENSFLNSYYNRRWNTK